MQYLSKSDRTLCRILDANLDRAREGLRVIEEWCRFGLENAALTEECKRSRQELAVWHTDDLRSARDTIGDPGTGLSHQNEETRSDIDALLRANLSRVQEALRVLEEYGKIYNSDMAAAVKQIRYRVYVLESNVMGQDRCQKLHNARLYLVTMPSENLLEVVESGLQGGLPLVQYRDKEQEDGIRLEMATALCELCHRYNALFLVNDRLDIAQAVGADGVHLGQQDMPIAAARAILGKDYIIGQSTTNPDELKRALESGADYVGVGPVYATPTKPGKAAAGLEYVSYVADRVAIPWFAIGGIDLENLPEVIAAGARRVAVVRSLMQAENPRLASQSMLSLLEASIN
ncbi:thiamine phosphate synthase [Pseudanabaena sp. PCC 6802]|uniref:thiamine phosphate synthase n=1 Tax=Pseudanabaena sp. PCC 6802 TaxID=118173 RepID=UPI0003495D0E|nr:thiamine phosphate synthase [Pseudanabaena sp. PCC 6802]